MDGKTEGRSGKQALETRRTSRWNCLPTCREVMKAGELSRNEGLRVDNKHRDAEQQKKELKKPIYYMHLDAFAKSLIKIYQKCFHVIFPN